MLIDWKKKMKKISQFILIFICLSASAKAQDTLFAAIKGESLFLPHIVLPKQNLYRISRYYSSSVVDIKILNNMKEDTVKAGSVIMIPLVKRNFGIHPNKNKTDVKYQPVYTPAHTLKNKRMLLAVTPYDADDFEQFLKRKKCEFNTKKTCIIGYVQLRNSALTSTDVKKLTDLQPPIIEPKKDTLPKIVIKKDTIKKVIKANADTIIALKKPSQLILLEKLYFRNESLEINEKGTAISFQVDSLGNYQKGFYALHNTLPIGTIIKLVNPMNQNEVMVKVLGKIPEIAGNNRCNIKISHDAALYLDAKDERFLVELFYH
ncbi:MAG: hypothetical protein RIQ33_1133 [Bacteroidota bacterium]